jgi:glycerol uptake facilitator-like aquaporin
MWVILVAVFDGPIIKTVKTPSYSIGMALGVLVLVGGNISGSSLNFARYFGPALFGDGSGPQSGLSSQWWIYFTGPLFGDAFAALLWYFVFRKGNHLLETELLSQ